MLNRTISRYSVALTLLVLTALVVVDIGPDENLPGQESEKVTGTN
jgi:hypothetical protein